MRMKKVLPVLACVFLLSLSGCGAGSTETSDSLTQAVSNESSVSSERARQHGKPGTSFKF